MWTIINKHKQLYLISILNVFLNLNSVGILLLCIFFDYIILLIIVIYHTLLSEKRENELFFTCEMYKDLYEHNNAFIYCLKECIQKL